MKYIVEMWTDEQEGIKLFTADDRKTAFEKARTLVEKWVRNDDDNESYGKNDAFLDVDTIEAGYRLLEVVGDISDNDLSNLDLDCAAQFIDLGERLIDVYEDPHLDNGIDISGDYQDTDRMSY